MRPDEKINLKLCKSWIVPRWTVSALSAHGWPPTHMGTGNIIASAGTNLPCSHLRPDGPEPTPIFKVCNYTSLRSLNRTERIHVPSFSQFALLRSAECHSWVHELLRHLLVVCTFERVTSLSNSGRWQMAKYTGQVPAHLPWEKCKRCVFREFHIFDVGRLYTTDWQQHTF